MPEVDGEKAKKDELIRGVITKYMRFVAEAQELGDQFYLERMRSGQRSFREIVLETPLWRINCHEAFILGDEPDDDKIETYQFTLRPRPEQIKAPPGSLSLNLTRITHTFGHDDADRTPGNYTHIACEATQTFDTKTGLQSVDFDSINIFLPPHLAPHTYITVTLSDQRPQAMAVSAIAPGSLAELADVIASATLSKISRYDLGLNNSWEEVVAYPILPTA